jgi:hypothetical protein
MIRPINRNEEIYYELLRLRRELDLVIKRAAAELPTKKRKPKRQFTDPETGIVYKY